MQVAISIVTVMKLVLLQMVVGSACGKEKRMVMLIAIYQRSAVFVIRSVAV